MKPRLSIIIPTLNEEPSLDSLLTVLRRDFTGAEVIVADGGSDDDTLKIAHTADRVIHAPRGRAAQMNAGASVATGEVLWFLHSDSIPPRDALARIEKVLSTGCCGGCFRIWFDEPAWVFRISDALSNLKVDLTGIAYGDHGIFCTTEAFHRISGYPVVPLLEDADLYRALGHLGGVSQAPAHIFTNARRYHAHGPWRTTLIHLILSTLYLLGYPREKLAHFYARQFGAGRKPLAPLEEIPRESTDGGTTTKAGAPPRFALGVRERKTRRGLATAITARSRESASNTKSPRREDQEYEV